MSFFFSFQIIISVDMLVSVSCMLGLRNS